MFLAQRKILTIGILLALGACAGIQPGGQYSGIPDTRTGSSRNNMETGSISSSGVIYSNRDGYLISPTNQR